MPAAKIDQAELAVLFKGLNIHLTAEEVADLMKAVDQDESGSIDFPEFCRMMVLHLGVSVRHGVLLLYVCFCVQGWAAANSTALCRRRGAGRCSFRRHGSNRHL